jgi:uncharacterized protein YaaQ
MGEQSIEKLMIAIVQEQDVDVAERALGTLNLAIFHLASAGGFLGRRNATLLIGMPGGMEQEAVNLLMKSCRQRVEYLAIPLEGAAMPLPTPMPVTVGGATVFNLPVERFEEF